MLTLHSNSHPLTFYLAQAFSEWIFISQNYFPSVTNAFETLFHNRPSSLKFLILQWIYKLTITIFFKKNYIALLIEKHRFLLIENWKNGRIAKSLSPFFHYFMCGTAFAEINPAGFWSFVCFSDYNLSLTFNVISFKRRKTQSTESEFYTVYTFCDFQYRKNNIFIHPWNFWIKSFIRNGKLILCHFDIR